MRDHHKAIEDILENQTRDLFDEERRYTSVTTKAGKGI
jgi:hypothetical protein